MGLELEVNISALSNISGELNGAYNRLSKIKDELESIHTGLENCWEDAAMDDFSCKYDEGMERIWDLLVAIDSIDSFVIAAKDGYTATDRLIESL